MRSVREPVGVVAMAVSVVCLLTIPAATTGWMPLPVLFVSVPALVVALTTAAVLIPGREARR